MLVLAPALSHSPKRLELLLYTVRALPMASRRKEDSRAASVSPPELATRKEGEGCVRGVRGVRVRGKGGG